MAQPQQSEGSMMNQAQHIWSMLDDMANNDPTAYRRFIDKQLKEGKEAMKPMEPHMCIHTKILGPGDIEPLTINVCSWHRIPEPKSDENPIPVMGGSIYRDKDDKGELKIIAVTFNPNILERYGRNSKLTEERSMLINLALDYIEDNYKLKLSRSFTILPNSITHKGDLAKLRDSFNKKVQKAEEEFERDFAEIERTFGPGGMTGKESLLNQLSNISVQDNQSDDRTHHMSQSGDLLHQAAEPHIRMPGSASQSKKGLVEEVSQSGDLSTSLPEPSYDVDMVTEGGVNKYKVKIKLPGVKSVADCELDISQDDLSLTVPDLYQLHHKFSQRVEENEARAKFSKKTNVLTVILPTVCS